MSNLTNTFTRGYAAFQQGQFELAYRLFADSSHPQAAHLLGLSARRLGRLDDALDHLERALSAEPANMEILHNQSLVFLDLGRFDEAIQRLGHVLKQKPDFLAAYRTLGRALRQAQRWSDAKVFYHAFLARWPNDRSARFGLGMAELETGDVERSAERFKALLNEGDNDASIHFMYGRASLEAGNHPQAKESLITAHEQAPSALTLRELGRLFWMQGDRKAFAGLIKGPFSDGESLAVALTLMRQSGVDVESLSTLLRNTEFVDADHLAIVAQAYVDQGDAVRALDHANRCLEKNAHHEAGLAAKISALLMQGSAEEALSLTRAQQCKQPNAQQWIAFETTALRLAGSDEYRPLINVDQHVQIFELPVPEGYPSLEAFNRAFEQSLSRLQLFKQEPIDQSLRGGTQSARDLRSVDDPAIQAYLGALDAPIRSYLDRMGKAPNHPLSRRNTGDYRLNGCWSVRLSGGGHHVNHMHPEGWISSAYYVRVPDQQPDQESDRRSGWIHFSQPPFVTTPALEPERYIRPKPGMLVLFPSYLWHGTEPIKDSGVRVTAPFDVVPQ